MVSGIHNMVPRDEMHDSARKLRDIYENKADAPFIQREFGFFSLDKWQEEGHLDGNKHDAWEHDEYIRSLLGLDEPGNYTVEKLGWEIAAFYPAFEEKTIEDRGEYEVIQDCAGRHVLFFKGRRSGFMPEYLDHPVKDMKTWEEKCKWRLDASIPGRFDYIEGLMKTVRHKAAQGMVITQRVIGGYMYLRSLMGSEDLLYKFYDEPELVHDCMKTWLELSDEALSRHQEYFTIDELFLSEDICYNKGSLISPDMIREFLFPYYQQLIANVKARQLDKLRHLYVQIDTDGFANPVIPVYKEIGMDVMSPFEVASGCDVVEIGKMYPDLKILGGVDKRILAEGKEEIDRHLDHILPAMRKRGGYIPTCDHGVPAEVSFENYLYYRKRVSEYSK